MRSVCTGLLREQTAGKIWLDAGRLRWELLQQSLTDVEHVWSAVEHVWSAVEHVWSAVYLQYAVGYVQDVFVAVYLKHTVADIQHASAAVDLHCPVWCREQTLRYVPPKRRCCRDWVRDQDAAGACWHGCGWVPDFGAREGVWSRGNIGWFWVLGLEIVAYFLRVCSMYVCMCIYMWVGVGVFGYVCKLCMGMCVRAWMSSCHVSMCACMHAYVWALDSVHVYACLCAYVMHMLAHVVNVHEPWRAPGLLFLFFHKTNWLTPGLLFLFFTRQTD